MFKNKLNLILLIIILILSAFLYKLMEEPKEPLGLHSEKLAQIGPYVLNTEDYRQAAANLPSAQQKLLDSPQGRWDLLDALIKEELLLSKARSEKLDISPGFLKRIEYHWKKSLVKELFLKLQDEAWKHSEVSEHEIQKFYEHMTIKYELRILEFSSKEAALAAKTQLQQNPKQQQGFEDLIYDSGWTLSLYESIHPIYRKYVIYLKQMRSKIVQRDDQRYGLLIVAKQHPRSLRPLSELKEILHNLLRQEQFQNRLNLLIQNIKQDLSVTRFDYDLNSINLNLSVDNSTNKP